jgi:hypothetical protein
MEKDGPRTTLENMALRNERSFSEGRLRRGQGEQQRFKVQKTQGVFGRESIGRVNTKKMPVWFITVSQYTAQCLVYDRIPKKYLLNA